MRFAALATLLCVSYAPVRAVGNDFGTITIVAHSNGTTDATARILEAVSRAALRRPGIGLLLPNGAGYRVTSTITIPVGIDFDQRGPLICEVPAPPCLVIGEAGKPNSGVRLSGIDVRRHVRSDWSDESDVGVRIINAHTASIEIRRASNFTVGAQLMGDAGGFAYNRVSLGYIIGNGVGLDLTQRDSGWVNENLFSGGNFTTSTGTYPGVGRVGVRLTSIDNTYTDPNNNVFLKPSFEYDDAASVPMLLVHGSQNRFMHYRTEGGFPYAARMLNGATENYFEGGYDQLKGLDDQSSYSGNTHMPSRQPHVAMFGRTVARFHLRELRSESAGRIEFDGMSVLNSSGYPLRDHATSGLALQADGSVEVAGQDAVGFVIDTSVVKQFVLTKGLPAGRGGGIFLVRAMDAGGARLSSADAGHPHVRGPVYSPGSYSAIYGGVYSEGDDSNLAWLVRFGQSVSSAWVGVARGTAPAYVTSIAVHSALGGPDPAVWSGVP